MVQLGQALAGPETLSLISVTCAGRREPTSKRCLLTLALTHKHHHHCHHRHHPTNQVRLSWPLGNGWRGPVPPGHRP